MNIDAVKEVVMPPATSTYAPIDYVGSVRVMQEVTEAVLTPMGFRLANEHFDINQRTQTMIGKWTFEVAGGDPGLRFQIAMLNSVNKRRSFTVGVGVQVVVCHNGMFSGAGIFEFRRRHVGSDAFDDACRLISTATGQAAQTYQRHLEDKQLLSARPISDDEAAGTIFRALDAGVISPSQVLPVRQAWAEPAYDEFGERNNWSLYNAFTEIMKGNRPELVLERHQKLHELIIS